MLSEIICAENYTLITYCCFIAVKKFRNVLITTSLEQEVVNTDVNSDVVCTYHPGRPEVVHRFNCTNRMYGRYVRVTMLNVIDSLNLYEIEVIGFQ